MRIPQIAAIVAICSWGFPSFALDPDRAVTQYVHRIWTVEDGLPQDRIHSIAQTSDGYHLRVEFHDTVPTFIAPERVSFRDRPRGFRYDEWIDAGNRHAAYSTNLPPGTYELSVAGSASGEDWVTAPPIRMRRPPRFYQTAWFLTLWILAATSLAWLLHRTRLRSVRLRHEAVIEERTRIAREFHDTMDQGLTGLTLHVEAAIHNLHDPARAGECLQSAKKLARNAVADAKRALFDLRPEALDGRDLAMAMRHMLASMTDKLPVRGTVVVRGAPRPLADARAENHLLRIAQEAVTNALRHARATNIEILLDFEPALVRLSVRDDGHGAGACSLDELEASGNGVRGMRERADQIGASLDVRRNGERGMEISVEAPV